jgi:Hypothetical protein (DUF2513)
MKRDLDLIRSLMLELEEKLQPGESITYEANYGDSQGMYQVEHVRLLIDSDFIEVIDASHMGGLSYVVTRITNPGHDFLDAMRSESVWNSVKAKAAKVGSWTFDLLVDCAKDEIKRRFLGGEG